MKRKNELGFGAVLVLIILAVALLVGFAGWYVMKHKDKTTPSSLQTATPTDKQGITTTSGATKYLTIREWDVKFALTTDTADAYYDHKTTSSIESMSLRSHALDSESDCTDTPLSVAGIFRVAKDAPDDTIPGKKYSETQDGKTIGNYFYFVQSSQYNCTDDVDKQVILQGIRNSFNTAGPTIQKL